MTDARFTIRLSNGIVVGCNDADDLEDALQVIRALEDAPLQRLVDGTIVAQTAAALVAYERELQWNHQRVGALLLAVHGGQRRILEALVELDQDVLVSVLADRLGRTAHGLGPSLAAISKRARELFPGSPPPLRSDGDPGRVVVHVNPTFLDTLRLLVPTRAQIAELQRDLRADADEQEEIAREWSAVDADGLDEASS